MIIIEQFYHIARGFGKFYRCRTGCSEKYFRDKKRLGLYPCYAFAVNAALDFSNA